MGYLFYAKHYGAICQAFLVLRDLRFCTRLRTENFPFFSRELGQIKFQHRLHIYGGYGTKDSDRIFRPKSCLCSSLSSISLPPNTLKIKLIIFFRFKHVNKGFLYHSFSAVNAKSTLPCLISWISP